MQKRSLNRKSDTPRIDVRKAIRLFKHEAASEGLECFREDFGDTMFKLADAGDEAMIH